MTFLLSRFVLEAKPLPPPDRDGQDLPPIMNTSGPPGTETKPKPWQKPIALGRDLSLPGKNHDEVPLRIPLHPTRSLEPPGECHDHDIFFRDTWTRNQTAPPIKDWASDPPSRGSPDHVPLRGILHVARRLRPPGHKRLVMPGKSPPGLRIPSYSLSSISPTSKSLTSFIS